LAGAPGHWEVPLVVAKAVNVTTIGDVVVLIRFVNAGIVFVPVVGLRFPIPAGKGFCADHEKVTFDVVLAKFTAVVLLPVQTT
jgi:hypothetical protein